jgi:hypothetical protein
MCPSITWVDYYKDDDGVDDNDHYVPLPVI